MAHVFIANFCDLATVDAEMDDPSLRGESPQTNLEQMASPQLSHVFLSMPSVKRIEALLKEAYDELMDLYDDDGEDKPELSWVFKHEPSYGAGHRECWTWRLSDGTTEYQAMVVLQKVEVSAS